MKRILLATTLLLFAFGQEKVNACSCAGRPSPCEAFAAASGVVIGYVTKVEPEKPDRDQQGNEYYGEQVAHVRVERSFKGLTDEAIVLHQPGHNCAPKFKVGERWLLYAHYDAKSKTWEVFGCGRSSGIEYANDDLLYLQGLPDSAAKTRLSGTIKHYEDTPEKGFSLVKNVAGAKVKVIGSQKIYGLYTDQNGVYEIYGLPPGKYGIEPEIPFGLQVRFPMAFGPVDYSDRKSFKVELKANSCAGSDFVLGSYSSITGRVFGTNGQVMPRACLDLLPTDQIPDRYFRIFGCTKEDGSYELNEIPPGKYLIVINKDGRITGDEPFVTTYYPGVFEKDKAAVVTIREGDKLDKHDILIPSQQLTHIVEGVLQYSDGSPVARQFIDFKADQVDSNYDRNARTVTDDQGRFSFKALHGTIGLLRGYLFAYRGAFLNCLYVDKLLEDKADQMTIEVEAKRIRIEVNRDIQNIKLVFPFPFCAKNERKQD